MKHIRILFIILLCTPAFAANTGSSKDKGKSEVVQGSKIAKYDGFRILTTINKTGETIEFKISASVEGFDNLLSASNVYRHNYDRYSHMEGVYLTLQNAGGANIYLRGVTKFDDPDMKDYQDKTGYDPAYESLTLSYSIIPIETQKVSKYGAPLGKDETFGQNVEVKVKVDYQRGFTVYITKSGEKYVLIPFVDISA